MEDDICKMGPVRTDCISRYEQIKKRTEEKKKFLRKNDEMWKRSKGGVEV
jgi:hypothetical protein